MLLETPRRVLAARLSGIEPREYTARVQEGWRARSRGLVMADTQGDAGSGVEGCGEERQQSLERGEMHALAG